MKKNELLSITDENAILITAEFIDKGLRIKNGNETIHRYEFDLIVKRDITFNQLLQAIYRGLWRRSGGATDTMQITFRDSRDVGQVLEDRLPNLTPNHSMMTRNQQRKIEDAIIAQSRIDYRANVLDRLSHPIKSEVQKQPHETDVKADSEIFDICLKVFKSCYLAYSNDIYSDEKKLAQFKQKYGYISIIGIGSTNIPRNGTYLSVSDRAQRTLSSDSDAKTLAELGFMTSTRVVFDLTSWHRSAPLFDERQIKKAFVEQIPKYNISDQPLLELDTNPVHVIPPTEPPQKNSRSLLLTLLSPLLMTGAMLVARFFSYSGTGNQSSMLWMTLPMAFVTVLIAVMNVVINQKEYAKSLDEWRKQYETYVSNLLNSIQSKQKWDIRQLKSIYPSVQGSGEGTEIEADNLVKKAIRIDGEIFSRNQKHPDFLTVRLGLSGKSIPTDFDEEARKAYPLFGYTPASQLAPSVFPIVGEKKDAVFSPAKYQNIGNLEGYPFHILLPKDVRHKGSDDGYYDASEYLINLPTAIANRYGYLIEAPVLLKLKECGTLGVIIQSDRSGDKTRSFLSNMLFSLCFYHSPDDLQCVMLCKEEPDLVRRQHLIRRYKHLPHFRELLGNISAFAFNKKGASLVFNKLLEILREYEKSGSELKAPHIVVVVQEEYELKRHPVSEYLPKFSDKEQSRISFIFCKRHQEELPKYCGRVILVNDKNEWFIQPHVQTKSRPESQPEDDENAKAYEHYDIYRYRFIPDQSPATSSLPMENGERVDEYYRAFKVLSALYYERIAQNAGVPERVDLFELFRNLNLKEDGLRNKTMVESSLKRIINEAWDSNLDICETLRVPIGKKTDDREADYVYLDLHEKHDGPHMLVAGTTGSGKTETILTYLVNLCALYRPDQVNLLLMDMKGAGFVTRIGGDEGLPHIVGAVTDVDGDENGTGMTYMLKRFLLSMNAEVKRRKLQLRTMDVDNINDYIQARNNLDEHIKSNPRLSLDTPEGRKRREELKRLPPMPHLFMVVDEFTELMRFTAENDDVDFRAAITSLARIGRSLGFHIILISQNIEGAITPDIRVNSRARLCLRVATREASKEMIGEDYAADPRMPGNGRAYLLIGTGSRFEYFQSGYSGADVTPRSENPIVVTLAEVSDNYSLFYDSENKEYLNADEDIFTSGKTKSPRKTNDSDQDETNAPSASTDNTQLKALVEQIRVCANERYQNCISNGDLEGAEHWKAPHNVFQQPLPNRCYYNFNHKKYESL